ncbi:MAG: hypothetical protein WDW36_003481 [Sanguina aurantia]
MLLAHVQGARLHEAAAALFGPPSSPEQPYKIVLGGRVLANTEASVKLAAGDVLLVAHPRKAPSAQLVAAVLGAGDEGGAEEVDPRARLPRDAPAWEHTAVRVLREQWKAPEWVVDWVILLRPFRLLLLACFPPACLLASHLSLGPIFILAAIITVIFTNLGQRKEGGGQRLQRVQRGAATAWPAGCRCGG